MTCVLCNEKIRQGCDHNPAPLSDHGRCCSWCNSTRVIPERLKHLLRDYHAKN